MNEMKINLVDFIQRQIDKSNQRSPYDALQLSEHFKKLGLMFGLINEDGTTTEDDLLEVSKILIFFNDIKNYSKRDLSDQEIKEYLLPYKIEGRRFVDISIFRYSNNGILVVPISVFLFGAFITDARGILHIGTRTYHSEVLVGCYKDLEGKFAKSTEEKSPSKTYIIHDCNTGHYKIGRLNNLYIRFNDLRIANPSVSLIMSCHADIENKLHQKYAIKRQTGEWFNLSEYDLLEIMDEFKAVGGEFFNANLKK